MEPSYSAFADLLNKFHTASPAIQALWLVVVGLVAGHAASVAGRVLAEALRLLDRRWARRDRTTGVLFQGPDGRWMLHADGEVRALTAAELAERVAGLPGPTSD